MNDEIEKLKKDKEYLYSLLNENTVYQNVPPGTKLLETKLHNRRVGLAKIDKDKFVVRFKNLVPKSRKIQKVQFAISREALYSLFYLFKQVDIKNEKN